jgi:hypothetical protein
VANGLRLAARRAAALGLLRSGTTREGIGPRTSQGGTPMTDEQLAEMHRLLAEYHRGLAKEAVLDVIQQYHSDLAQRFSDEAALIPRRTAIVERLHERERQKREDGE